MMITGSGLSSAINSSCNSSQSIPGMRISAIRQIASMPFASSRNRSADSKATTSKPETSRRSGSESRKSSSSSTTKTFPLDAVMIQFLHQRKAKAKDCSSERIGLRPDSSAVLLYNGAADGQSKSHSTFLGRHKWLEEAPRHLIGHA